MNGIGITYYELGDYMNAYPEEIQGRKTPIYKLYNKKDESIYLGEIKWNGAWRKYCFYPEYETLFDSKCLMELVKFIDYLMKERKNKGV